MSYCIPSRKVCDGVIDCPVGDDEAMCTNLRCPGHMRCYGVNYCVPPHEICDGIGHCLQQESEKYCQVCPKVVSAKEQQYIVTIEMELYQTSICMLHLLLSSTIHFHCFSTF